MDTLPKKTNPPSDQVLLRVQEILCSGPLSIIPGKPPKEPHPRHRAYQVNGVDYTGPLRYRVKSKQEGKAYILLCACSITRGLFLKLMPSLEMPEFLCSLKRLIARWGHPERIYSHIGWTFIGAEKWIKVEMADEKSFLPCKTSNGNLI